MKRLLITLLLLMPCLMSRSQTVQVPDSTFILFPNPSRGNIYITSEVRIVYAMFITSSGEKKTELHQYDILSYPNAFGLGCTSAGCIGARVASNFICTIPRGILENGLYHLVLYDEWGRLYFKRVVFN